MKSLLAFGVAVLLAGTVQAATLSEADQVGGDFSGAFAAPSRVGPGTTVVHGGWQGGGDADILHLSLAPGAQTVQLTFAPLAPVGSRDWSFSAGGTVLWSERAFRHAWDGTRLGNVSLHFRNTTASLTLALDESFAGDLWLGLYGTHGRLGYAVALPTSAPSVVPVPAGLGLLATGLAGFAGLRRLRRRA